MGIVLARCGCQGETQRHHLQIDVHGFVEHICQRSAELVEPDQIEGDFLSVECATEVIDGGTGMTLALRAGGGGGLGRRTRHDQEAGDDEEPAGYPSAFDLASRALRFLRR
jgi:hypothetical protein